MLRIVVSGWYDPGCLFSFLFFYILEFSTVNARKISMLFLYDVLCRLKEHDIFIQSENNHTPNGPHTTLQRRESIQRLMKKQDQGRIRVILVAFGFIFHLETCSLLFCISVFCRLPVDHQCLQAAMLSNSTAGHISIQVAPAVTSSTSTRLNVLLL